MTFPARPGAPRAALAVAIFALAAGCATVSRPLPSLVEAAPADPAALAKAADAFYAAKDVAGMEEALARAEAAGPASGIFHELSATFARLQARSADEVDHRLQAALDPAYDATVLQLKNLDAALLTTEQREAFVGVLEVLSASHPRPDVRAQAAYFLAARRQVSAEDDGLRRALERLGPVLSFAVVGGWDNDQGKGFDAAQAPEQGVDLLATYEGSLMEIGWQQAPPRDYRGELELGDYIAPGKWSVAYAATGVRVANAGSYELRLATTDPVKVWVNGALVFQAREVERAWTVDQFVIPVALPAGDSQVLVKSAHRTGDWRLFARLTGEGGAKVPHQVVPAGAVAKPAKSAAVDTEALLEARVAHLPEDSVRRQVLLSYYAHVTQGGHVAIRHAQDLVGAASRSLFARYALMSTLWADNERGRTADLLGALVRDAGEALPYLAEQQARFWIQEGLRTRARKVLVSLVERYPDRPGPAQRLAQLFHEEKWTEDECRTLEALNQRVPGTLDLRAELARCLLEERRYDRAVPMLRALAEEQPRSTWILYRLHDALRATGAFAEAARTIQRVIDAYPEQLWPRLRLAETLRQAGNLDEADQALAHAQEAFPASALVRRERASLAWRRGQRDAAVEHWQAALVRDPDDESTANRLDYVAPATTGPWAADVPDESALEALVEAREQLQPLPGAELAYLLDHEVTQLRADGSTINVVTQVVTALNQSGRDRLTRQRLQYPGRHRVLQAWSVDKEGRRSEASVRSREVLYRGLDVGSTIVLQYRADSPPSGFLPRYLSRTWFFQSFSDQRRLARFVLWYPAGSTLHESVTGKLQREEKKVGDELRVEWSLKDAPPALAEPGMPTATEVVANLQLTTVPGWHVFQKWEAALMEGAIRDSAEVDQLALKLAEGATTVEEKLFRIHEFVMQEIRYQQDYESFIAGVKPHPASMVVERRYGDCKDKTVLFMTLAKKLGIETRFATVRTRNRGQVRKELPTQQFNHAIVYVPPQPGLPEGRFFDATADALDLDVLRQDDAGTLALVFDPDTRKHEWVPIPWQTPAHHRVRTELTFALGEDGSAKGELVLKGRGKMGALLRRVARNKETFRQFVQMVAGSHFTGADTRDPTPVEVKDLRKLAHVRAGFTAPNAARVEGDTLRLRLPTQWSLKKSFSLAERRHDLVLGMPNTQEWRFTVQVPKGMKVARLPSSGEIETGCFTLQRKVVPVPGGLEVEQTLTQRCERITAEEYPAYRLQVEQMSRFLDEELVVTPAKKPIIRPARARAD